MPENFTPGPWKVEMDMFTAKEGCSEKLMSAQIAELNGDWIAQLWNRQDQNFKGDDTTIANAHLIAAAPDLYEVCETFCEGCCGCDPDKPKTKEEMKYCHVGKAILKARGEDVSD